MYVIFPADDVVSLTYGRVILPRPSDVSQLSRVLNQLQAATQADSRIDDSFNEQLQNHLKNVSRSTSNTSDLLLNGGSNQQPEQQKHNFRGDRSPTNKQGKELCVAAATAALGIASFQQQHRAQSRSPAPELAPDPRLQITGLQSGPTTPGEFFHHTC